MEGVPSPYVIDFANYDDSYDTYDDLPATSAWMKTIGAALGKKFGITLSVGPEAWELDYAKKEMRTGSVDEIYTRRGVLGILLNGVGRLALSIPFPESTNKANTFAKAHGVVSKLAKHFGSLTETVDEVRTDDEIAKSYAGGERVVDTMHAQAYEAANKSLQVMAMDMKVRRELARQALEFFKNLSLLVADVADIKKYPPYVEVKHKALLGFAKKVMDKYREPETELALQSSLGETLARIQSHPDVTTKGRALAVVLIALYPDQTDEIIKVLVREYPRNISLFVGTMGYQPSPREPEENLIKLASTVHKNTEEVKLFSSHTGGHAQYVIAKAEQYYHAHRLGLEYVSPYAGFDMEAKMLDVEVANEAAHKVAYAMIDRGITTSVDDSIAFVKELLPIVESFPFLDLNDKKKEGSGNGTMQKRVSGAGGAPKKQKRDKQKEKKSGSERAKDRKKMESMDNKKNQEKVDANRREYSIFSDKNDTPLEKYLYIIGPYLSRIQTLSSRIRRLLKVNDPAGLRGAYRKGRALNSRILYRHRLDDFRLFAKKEIEKDQSYGFVVMGDLSSSTEEGYNGKNNRIVQDEILAASFLMAEVAERIGEKVMCSVGFFTNNAETVKRAGKYLSRGSIMDEIVEHGGGTNVDAAGTAIAEDLLEMEEFKMKDKTIIFITDGSFDESEFLTTVLAAKKYRASIAYFQISDSGGVQMCRSVEKFVADNAQGVRVRTRNLTTKGISGLPEAMAQLLKETIGIVER